MKPGSTCVLMYVTPVPDSSFLGLESVVCMYIRLVWSHLRRSRQTLDFEIYTFHSLLSLDFRQAVQNVSTS